MKYLIGVDIGTTGTKSAIFDVEGTLLADAYQESKLYYPKPGWVEQNPQVFIVPLVIPFRKSSVSPVSIQKMWPLSA